MLLDTLAHGCLYPFGARWTTVFQELTALTRQGAALPEGVYTLAGGPGEGGATASVSVYDSALSGRYESHRLMADIQMVLDGEEECRVLPLAEEGPGALTPEAPYDEGRDIVFYREKPDAAARIRLRPGLFALFTPRDVHMPGLALSRPCRVKKLVVKVPAAVLLPGLSPSHTRTPMR